MRSPHILLIGLGLAACGSDYELGEKDDLAGVGIESEDPDIEVTPIEVDYGKLSVADGESVTETITIANVGDGDLHISDIELLDPEAPFDIGAVGSVLVVPEDSTTFTVTFTPETSELINTQVLIHSDDPDEPTTAVNIIADGIAPMIEVDPESYDFGSMYIGCESTLELLISNVGDDALIIEDFNANTGSTELLFDQAEDVNGPLPWTVPAGGDVSVWVDYAPLDEYQDIQYLTITSNDPLSPTKMVDQEGNGALYGEALDVFEQPIQGSTDILFALDWSGSMYDDLANVESNFETFITTLSGLDADYHVAVVTADDGCFNGSDNYLDNTMSVDDQQEIFSTMVAGSYGSNTERGFMLAEAALSSSNVGSGGCNEGFYRDDATLAIVGVTDEPEQSVNPYTYYVSLFQAMKSDSDDVVIHAIAGDYPGGCGSADAGTGWYEATVATGGLFLSICATDFGSHLEDLAEGSTADLTSFELTDEPVPDTISVSVDGISVSNANWEYDASVNSVVFDNDTVPEGGSTIEIDYALMGDCDG